MGTFGTKGGGGSFGSKPSPADSVSDRVCHPEAVLAQPSDPPADSPPMPYDEYDVQKDNRKYDQWVKDAGCGSMAYLLLNMDEYWDEIDALPWEGKPHAPAGKNLDWRVLPNIFNNENLNELADCMMKNYGVNIRDGTSTKDIDKFWECKALLMRKKFGIEIPPPKEYDLESTFSFPIGCPPLCLEQSVVLNYSWRLQQYKLVKSSPTLFGKLFGTTPDSWSIVKGEADGGGHAIKAKVVSCTKLKICFEGYNGFPQGGRSIRICISPDGTIIESNQAQTRGECKKILNDSLKAMKTAGLKEPFRKECWESIFAIGTPSGGQVKTIITEVDCTERVRKVR